MIIEHIDFQNLKWPISTNGWTDQEIQTFIKTVIELTANGANVVPNKKRIRILHSNHHQVIYLQYSSGGSYKRWRCFLRGHWWDTTGTNRPMCRSMNTCMRCGIYFPGPE